MALGTKQARQRQEDLFYASERTDTTGHPFYEQLNRVLDEAKFDRFCEERCRGFYHAKVGRPSLAPGVYFRLLLIGFFEGIGSVRYRLAGGRQFESAPVSELRAGRSHAGSRDDFANAAVAG